MTKRAMTLMQACRDFFGLRINSDGKQQTGMEFAKEYKALSDDDRKEIQSGLEKQGYTIIASSGSMAAALNRESEKAESGGNVGSLVPA